MKIPYSIPLKLITLLVAGAVISAVLMMVTLNLLRPAEIIMYLVTLLPLVLPLGYTLQALVTRFNSGNSVSIAGLMGQDSLQLVLQKVR